MARRIDDETRAAICVAAAAGESYRAIADQFGVSLGMVAKLVRESGCEQERERSQTAKAAEARAAVAALRRDYDAAARIELLNKVFAKADEILDTADTPSRLQSLAIALGILIDKRRLEDGDVTSRTESVTDADVAEFDRRITRITTQRRAG